MPAPVTARSPTASWRVQLDPFPWSCLCRVAQCHRPIAVWGSLQLSGEHTVQHWCTTPSRTPCLSLLPQVPKDRVPSARSSARSMQEPYAPVDTLIAGERQVFQKPSMLEGGSGAAAACALAGPRAPPALCFLPKSAPARDTAVCSFRACRREALSSQQHWGMQGRSLLLSTSHCHCCFVLLQRHVP